MTFQDIILSLQGYWAKKGCLIQQPYDLEVGAGTFNPATFLRVLSCVLSFKMRPQLCVSTVIYIGSCKFDTNYVLFVGKAA